MSQLSFESVRPPLYSSSRHQVRRADRCEVDWMIRRHYLHKWPGVTVATLGLYTNDGPVGVLVFSLPPAETFTRYGGLTWELARLWVDDSEPRNTESWFIARAVRYVKRFHRDVVALVSYADPSVGHRGTIYRASNWIEDGRTDDERVTPRFDYVANGRRYGRASHAPDDAERVARVSKYRFWMRLRTTGGLSKRGHEPVKSGPDRPRSDSFQGTMGAAGEGGLNIASAPAAPIAASPHGNPGVRKAAAVPPIPAAATGHKETP